MDLILQLLKTTAWTFLDVLPILAIIFGFQLLVLRRTIANLKAVLSGLAYVIAGLSLFLVGLEEALFPVGKLMALQLTDPEFIHGTAASIGPALLWTDYTWVYLFAAAIGFSATIAEPSLIAVAIKANQVSAGAISVWGLRVAVAIGVAVGIALGTFRIVTGSPLHYYIIVVIQTSFAPRMIIALAYDSGGITTSTVTVPLVAAIGLGLASTIPGRSPLLDGFGLTAFASLFPIISVIGYAQIGSWWARRQQRQGQKNTGDIDSETILHEGYITMHFKLIIALVDDEKSDSILEAARMAGATGASVLNQVRGEGINAAKTFLGLELETQRDMLMFLVEEHLCRDILEAIARIGEFETEPGSGIAFQIDVEDAVGVAHQVSKLRNIVEEKL